MVDFFAALFEWWGLNGMYSTDLADHLRGYDPTCTDYSGTPWYNYTGITMLAMSVVFYALYYHVLDSSRWQRRGHWFIFVLIAAGLSFLVGFILTYNALQSSEYCLQLQFTIMDCVGFGASMAIWTMVVITLISLSPYPRGLSNNCRLTPWKQ